MTQPLRLCGTCRNVSPELEAHCPYCGASSRARRRLQTRQTKKTVRKLDFSEEPALVAKTGGLALAGIVFTAACILFDAHNALLVVPAVLLSTIFFGVLMVGVPVLRKASRATGSRLDAGDDCWTPRPNEGETQLDGTLRGRLVASWLYDRQSHELLARRVRGQAALRPDGSQDEIALHGPIWMIDHDAAWAGSISQREARRLFAIPHSIQLPSRLSLYQATLDDGQRCQARGTLREMLVTSPAKSISKDAYRHPAATVQWHRELAGAPIVVLPAVE
jgi:hypothetical protein